MSWPQETLKVAVLSDSRMWNMILRHWWYTHIQVWCPRCLSFWRRWRSSLAWSNSQTPPFLGHPLCSMEQPWYSSGYPLDHVSFQFRSHLPCGFLAEFNKFASVPMIDCSFHLPTTIHTHFVKYDVNWLLKISTSTTIQNFRLGVYWPQQKISMITRLVKLCSSESLSIFLGNMDTLW